MKCPPGCRVGKTVMVRVKPHVVKCERVLWELEMCRSDRHNLSIAKAQLGRVSSGSSNSSIRCLRVFCRWGYCGCRAELCISPTPAKGRLPPCD